VKVSNLIEILQEFDPDATVAVGRTVLLGGGLSAIVNTGNVYVVHIADTVVIHTDKPSDGPEWKLVRGEENTDIKDEILTDF
jgi:hypothetical protein